MPWRYLPHDYPPRETVYGYFAHGQDDGVLHQLVELTRLHVRTAAGHDPKPTACAIDSQSVKTAPTVPTATQGIDAGKKIAGRRRSIIVDTLGLLLMVCVTRASTPDGPAGIELLTRRCCIGDVRLRVAADRS
nr:transposase [Frankia gtarii]